MNYLTFHSIANSNLPAREKSHLMGLYERARGSRLAHHAHSFGKSLGLRNGHIREAGHVALEALLATATGTGLAYLNSKVGLDKYSLPLDAGIAGLAYLGAIASHEDGALAHAARNVGNDSWAIFSFRKGGEWIARATHAAGGKVAGEFGAGENLDDYGSDFGGNDPIVVAAQAL